MKPKTYLCTVTRPRCGLNFLSSRRSGVFLRFCFEERCDVMVEEENNWQVPKDQRLVHWPKCSNWSASKSTITGWIKLAGQAYLLSAVAGWGCAGCLSLSALQSHNNPNTWQTAMARQLQTKRAVVQYPVRVDESRPSSPFFLAMVATWRKAVLLGVGAIATL